MRPQRKRHLNCLWYKDGPSWRRYIWDGGSSSDVRMAVPNISWRSSTEFKSYLLQSQRDLPGCSFASLVAQMVKRLPAMWGDPGLIPGSGRSLQKEMATHSRIFAWRIPWMEEPGRLQSMGLQRVGQDWATSLTLILMMGRCVVLFSGYIIILEWKSRGNI